MNHTSTLSEIDILSDAIAPDDGDMSASAAKSVLGWKFSKRAVARMNRLASKNSQGRLSDVEQLELNNFMRVGNLIDLIQAKARLSLKPRRSA